MGMTRAALDLQIQQETQKAIGQLQQNMKQIDGILQVIDSNMRHSHMALLQDITRLTVRVNFLLAEAKIGKTEEEAKELENRFKTFAEDEAKKMQAGLADAIAKREQAEAAAAGGPGSENTPNVVQ